MAPRPLQIGALLSILVHGQASSLCRSGGDFPAEDQTATIDLSRLQARRLRAWWYDPRSGVGTPIEEPLNTAKQEFRSPPYGPDWVLVVDDAERNYPPPGLVRPV